MQTLYGLQKCPQTWGITQSGSNRVSFFDENDVLLDGNCTAARSHTVHYATGQFLTFDLAARNGGSQPTAVKTASNQKVSYRCTADIRRGQ